VLKDEAHGPLSRCAITFSLSFQHVAQRVEKQLSVCAQTASGSRISEQAMHSFVLLVNGLIEKVDLLRLLGAKLLDLSFERIDLESKKVSLLGKFPQLR
jgi:hypothetical protein